MQKRLGLFFELTNPPQKETPLASYRNNLTWVLPPEEPTPRLGMGFLREPSVSLTPPKKDSPLLGAAPT